MNRLKELRGKESQQKIASRFGITQRTYSNYESGATQIPDLLKTKFADYFNVSIDYLLGRDTEKAPADSGKDLNHYMQLIKEAGFDKVSFSPEELRLIEAYIKGLLDNRKK